MTIESFNRMQAYQEILSSLRQCILNSALRMQGVW